MFTFTAATASITALAAPTLGSDFEAVAQTIPTGDATKIEVMEIPDIESV